LILYKNIALLIAWYSEYLKYKQSLMKLIKPPSIMDDIVSQES